MASGMNQHEKDSGPPLTTLPNAGVVSYAQQRAKRRIGAVPRKPFGKRVLNVVRNLMWVVPLTILVWLYAEREQLDQARISIPISIVSDRSDHMVTLLSPQDKTLVVEIEGTKARIEQARQELMEKGGIQIVVPAKTPLGATVPLPALEPIATNNVFASRGIVVKAVTPASLSLKVDEVIEGVEVQPQVPPDIAVRLDGPVVFDPPMVKLSGPRSMLTDPANPPRVIADIGEQMLKDGDIPAVALRLKEPNEQIRYAPSTVKAKVRLKSTTATYMLSSVPVFVMGPPALMDKYRVVFPNGSFIPRVTVIGPEDEIARIKNNEFIPKAILEIRQEDVRERLPRSPSSYILPPHVTVSDEEKNRTVYFNLEERTRPE